MCRTNCSSTEGGFSSLFRLPDGNNSYSEIWRCFHRKLFPAWTLVSMCLSLNNEDSSFWNWSRTSQRSTEIRPFLFNQKQSKPPDSICRNSRFIFFTQPRTNTIVLFCLCPVHRLWFGSNELSADLNRILQTQQHHASLANQAKTTSML